MNVKDYQAILDGVEKVVRGMLEKHQPPKPEPYDDSVLVELVESLQEEIATLKIANQELRSELQTFKEESGRDIGKTDEMLTSLSNAVNHDRERITQLEETDVAKHVSDAVETLWDEQLKHEVAAMLPDEITADAVADRLRDTKEFVDQIRGEKGDKGDPGKATTKEEVVKELASVVPTVKEVAGFIMDDKTFIAGVKGEKGDPGDVGPPPTQGQVDAAVEKLKTEVIKACAKMLPELKHVGTFQAGTTYFPGQEVIKNDSSYRALAETSEAPPGPDWQVIAKSRRGTRGQDGEPGEKGEKGDRGPVGPMPVSGVMTDDTIIMTFDDGSTVDISIEKGDDDEPAS